MAIEDVPGRVVILRVNVLRRVEDLGRARSLDHLWLAVRGGMGLEEFDERAGWSLVGRHPRALAVGPEDVRDEVFIVLTL